MRRALGLVVLVFLLAWARVAFAEGYTPAADPLFGLAPLDETALAKVSRPEPSRVILWDDEPPKSSHSVHHARGARPGTPSRGVVAIPATSWGDSDESDRIGRGLPAGVADTDRARRPSAEVSEV